MLVRLVDFLKVQGITVMRVNLSTAGQETSDDTDVHIGSLINTWLLLREPAFNGERKRGMDALKSRGMSHSNQLHEFVLTDQGVELADGYVGPTGLLTC
jgi:circadian clock protein KaiC